METNDIVPILRMSEREIRRNVEKCIHSLEAEASRRGRIDCVESLSAKTQRRMTTLNLPAYNNDNDAQMLNWLAAVVDCNSTFDIQGVVLHYKAREMNSLCVSGANLITENIALSKSSTTYSFDHIHIPTLVRPFLSFKCTRILKVNNYDRCIDMYKLLMELDNHQHSP